MAAAEGGEGREGDADLSNAQVTDLVLVAGGRTWKLLPREDYIPPAKVRAPAPQPLRSTMIMGVRDIYVLVAQWNNLLFSEMRSESRAKEHVRARQLAFLLAREFFPQASLPRLGNLLHRDHTTVLHNLAAGQKRLMADSAFRMEYDGIKSEFERVGVFRPKALEAAE